MTEHRTPDVRRVLGVSTAWWEYIVDGVTHWVPSWQIRRHRPQDCWCLPEPEEVDGGWRLVHRALPGVP